MKDTKIDKDPNEEVDPDADYLGNIWGWKFSFIGLGIILFFLLFAIIRSQMLGVPLAPNPETTIISTDK